MKVSFTINGEDNIRQVVSNQAGFRPEYFLAFVLLDFEARILTQIPKDKYDNGKTLVMLMKECFQGIGLTKGTT
jgi:hypothetical protein